MRTDGVFTKLMMLTTSESDGEALTALRKANKIMADARINWEELLGTVRPPPDRQQDRRNERAQHRDVYGDVNTDADVIEPMFARAFKAAMAPSFRETMDGIYSWWLENGYLTRRQYEVVKKATEHRRDHRG